MDVTFWEEQVDAEAEREKGEDTSELLAGLFTVTPAMAGIEREATSEVANKARVIFIGFL
jgi:hypothetical protein